MSILTFQVVILPALGFRLFTNVLTAKSGIFDDIDIDNLTVGNLDILHNSNLSGNVNVSGTLIIEGNTEIDGNIDIGNGNIQISNSGITSSIPLNVTSLINTEQLIVNDKTQTKSLDVSHFYN